MTEKHLIDQTLDQENKWKESFDYPEYKPELWAAKFSHNIPCGDLRKYSFPDKKFQSWVHRLFEILHNTGSVEKLRNDLLDEEERKTIQNEIDAGF